MFCVCACAWIFKSHVSETNLERCSQDSGKSQNSAKRWSRLIRSGVSAPHKEEPDSSNLPAWIWATPQTLDPDFCKLTVSKHVRPSCPRQQNLGRP